MPQARVPHASFIASAESLILPFLAPRAFAESPIARRNRRPHGNNTREEKEEAKTKKRNDELRPVRIGSASKEEYWINATCIGSQRNGSDTAGGLLHTPRPRWKPAGSTQAQSPVGLRYADISTFTRQHTRSYLTIGVKSRWILAGSNPASKRIYNTGRETRPFRPTKQSMKRTVKRERAIAVERERLANLVAHELDVSMTNLQGNGQYRSLRRRITNLVHWDRMELDLVAKSSPDRHNLWTTRAFAALDRTIYPKIRGHTRKIIIKHDPRCARWSVHVFPNAVYQELDQTWDNWMTLDAETRQKAYSLLLVYLLNRKPARALQFIYVIMSDMDLHDVKAEIIADALGYLAKMHSQDLYNAKQAWSKDKKTIKKDFVSGVLHIYQKVLAEHRKICSQDLLYNLASIADTEDRKKLFDCFTEHRAYIGLDTMLHYANSFATGGDTKTALKCLRELHKINKDRNWDAIKDKERLRWTCALLLRKSMSKNEEYSETPIIVAELVRMGIKMDTLLYNVVMHNAMDARDYSTAFKVYNALDRNGLTADKYTYSILLHGCASQNDPGLFSKFAEHCAGIAEETKDAWLATDYLFYLYTCRRDSLDDMHSQRLLQRAYLRFFTPRPLLLISDRLTSDRVRIALYAASDTPTSTLTPPPVALYIMLQAGIRSALGHSPRLVMELYQRFTQLVQEGIDPSLSELAKNPTIWNAFLLAFCQKQQFVSASRLIKHMNDGSPRPNIYSWNILMQAFFKTDQLKAAERVYAILRSRGIEPDQYTYGVLLRGYARAQHIDRIGETMQYVDAETEMDPDLLNSLSRVVARKRLMLILEKGRTDRDAESAATAQAKNAVEEARWTAPVLEIGGSKPNPDAEQDIGPSRGFFLRRHLPVRRPVLITPQAAIEQNDELEDNLETSKSGQRQDAKVRQEFVSRKDSPPSKAFSTQSKPTLEPGPAIERAPMRRAIAMERKPADKQNAVTKAPRPYETRENLLDPDVQYRKLQEQLGLVTPSSPAEPDSSPAITSFGATLGYKSKDSIEREREAQLTVRVRRVAPGIGPKE
jgi:pentatricopeptide repeat protein